MGLDLGALLRGGAGISSGYQQGQQERAERERAAQQRALQDALLRAQTDNQKSLQDDRRIRQEGNAASALRQQGIDEASATEAERLTQERAAEATSQTTEANLFRGRFQQLANVPDDATVVRRGRELESFEQSQELARLNQELRPAPRPPASQSPASVNARLRADVTRNLRERSQATEDELDTRMTGYERRIEADSLGVPIASLPPVNTLSAQDTANALDATKRAFPEVPDSQFEEFRQSYLGDGQGQSGVTSPTEPTGDPEIQALKQQVQEMLRAVAERERVRDQLERGR